MAFAMRITGSSADWCEHEGAKAGQTGPEFVRSVIRLALQQRGIDYRSKPPRPPVPPEYRAPAPAPVDAGDHEDDTELPGQRRVPGFVKARDEIEKFKAGQQTDAGGADQEVDPFGQ